MSFDEIEQQVMVQGRELLRMITQHVMDARAAAEPRLAQVAGSDGVPRTRAERGHARTVVTWSGPVTVRRPAYRAPGAPNLHPADAALNLPARRYSWQVQQAAVRYALAGSYEQAQLWLQDLTGVSTGKQQLGQIVSEAAADVPGFYPSRPAAQAPPGLPLAISADGKGVAMRPGARRAGTARKARKRTPAFPGGSRLGTGEENRPEADRRDRLGLRRPAPGRAADPGADPGPGRRPARTARPRSGQPVVHRGHHRQPRPDHRRSLRPGRTPRPRPCPALDRAGGRGPAPDRRHPRPGRRPGHHGHHPGRFHPRTGIIHGIRRALINVFNDLDFHSLSPLLKSYLRGFRNDEERVLVAYCLAVRPASGERTWTVVDASYATVGPVEEWLEAHRYLWSPNTVRGYATSLAQWWSFLEQRDESGQWAEAGVPAVTGFLSWLRNGRTAGRSLAVPEGAPSADTLNARLAALLSFYQWQAAVHDVPVASRLMRGRPSRVLSRGLLAHLDGRRGLAPTSLVKVRRRRRDRPPLLLPQEIQAIIDGCASWDTAAGDWKGNLRDRLIFSVLAETGMRLGEVLGMTIGDFVMGLGGTAYIEVTPREGNANGARVKMMRPRRVHVSADLERLFAGYLTHLACRAASLGLEITPDSPLLVNLDRPPLLAAIREGTVRDKVTALKKKGIGPPGWTPHWFRHSHASALLLAGTPEWVVSRRVGHAHVQTTIDLYGWVREDEALKAAANWKTYTSGWRAGHDG